MSEFVLEAVAANHAAGVEIARHAHGDGQMTITLRGTALFAGDDGTWLAPPGLGIWVPPNVPHLARYSESSSLINLRLSSVLSAQLPTHCSSVQVSDLLRELAREAVRLHAGTDADPSIEPLAQLIVLQARRRLQGAPLFVPHGRDRRLLVAIGILRNEPGRALDLDELAALAHTSARTLARLFTIETGMTFGRWREHWRMVCAVDRLARGWSITQTALELGYQSASSFTTRFTALLGAPPRRYMRELQAQSGGETAQGSD